MKIKYRSNYKDGTEWSKAATYNVLALDKIGHEVELEEVSYNNANVYLDDRIKDIEVTKCDKYDIAINHILPMHFRNLPDTKNIGVAALETKTLSNKFWLKKFGLADNIISCNKSTQQTLEKYNLKSEVLHPLFDFDAVFSSPKTVDIPYLKTGFNFVFVGDTSTVKNLEAVVRAFHTEFEPFENVNLVIISNSANTEEFCNSVKKKLKLSGRAKKEVLVVGPTKTVDKFSVIRHCHASIIPSFGESWYYNLLECMALGVPPIYCQDNGVDDILGPDCSFAVQSKEVVCYGANDTFDDLYTSKDTWREIDVNYLKYNMRTAYSYLQSPNSMREAVTNKAMMYHYENDKVLQQISNFLEETK